MLKKRRRDADLDTSTIFIEDLPHHRKIRSNSRALFRYRPANQLSISPLIEVLMLGSATMP